MQIPGWANRSGPTGWSFGVFYEKLPHRLSEDHPLAVMLTEAAELTVSKLEKGPVAGREVRVSRGSQGERQVRVETPWMTLSLTEKRGQDSLRFYLEMPFGAQAVVEDEVTL